MLPPAARATEITSVMRPASAATDSPLLHRFAPLLAGLLLALFWWQATSASLQWSQTSDELPHLTAGYAYDKFGDFRMHSENGNLPQRMHGLAPLLLGARFPMDENRWRNSDYWQLGWDFLYGLGNDTGRMLYWARALNALFGVGLGALIFLFARRAHGDAGALVALGFYAFCPNFLTHSALATSDMAATLCLTLASVVFWWHLGRRDWLSGALAGLCSGLALVAKFNGVLLAPIYALLVLADVWWRGESRRGRRLGADLLLCLGQVLAGAAVIWAFFGFRYDVAGPGAPPLDKLIWDWPQMLSLIGWKARLILFLTDHHLLPYGWIYGLTNVLAGASARPAFLAGQHSLHGWREFFPVLVLTKTPLPHLAAVLAAVAIGVWRWRRRPAAERRGRVLLWLPLAVPALVVFGTAVFSNLNIGHRHILAAYPVLFAATGALATAGVAWRLAAIVLLAGQAVESVRIRPHYPAYFNQVAGGPAWAYRLVVDSSLDWGQALPALHDWLAVNRQPGEPVYLSYFGSAWPPYYGVKPTWFLPAVNIARPRQGAYDYTPGLYCLSASSLAEIYSSYNGPWQPQWDALLRDPGTDEGTRELLRFTRLCRYLQARRPDAEAGYAILIYRLSAREIDEALHGPVKGW
jgi:4-amino-4-deoxy-L-arabinose transferase-like glycosyltransferase